MLAGLQGSAYLDDNIVTVATLEEHNPCPFQEDRRVWISCPNGEVFVHEEGDQVSVESD